MIDQQADGRRGILHAWALCGLIGQLHERFFSFGKSLPKRLHFLLQGRDAIAQVPHADSQLGSSALALPGARKKRPSLTQISVFQRAVKARVPALDGDCATLLVER